MPGKNFPRPTNEEMRAVMRAVADECPDLDPDGTGESALLQEVIGLSLQVAVKWFSDVDAAGRKGGGTYGSAVAAEIAAYGAMGALFRYLPPGDVRRAAFAAGAHVGKFVTDRWAANERQAAFVQSQEEPT